MQVIQKDSQIQRLFRRFKEIYRSLEYVSNDGGRFKDVSNAERFSLMDV